MAKPVDDFLAHFGVRGMKWGRRKQARVINREAQGKKAVDRSGGSVKKAAWKIVGQQFATELLLGAGNAVVASTLSKSAPAVALGYGAVSNLVGMGTTVYNINRGVNLHAYANRDK